MKLNLYPVALVLALHFTFGAVVQCQDRRSSTSDWEKIRPLGVVQAGIVNALEGPVEFLRGNAPFVPSRSEPSINAGDLIAVGNGAHLEILLVPGSYLRLGPNTRAAITDLTSSNIKIKILSGSAIVETVELTNYFSNIEDVYDPITLSTPKARFVLVTGGFYRLNVSSDGVSNLSVGRGLAVAGDKRVTNGLQLRMDTAGTHESRFAIKQSDEFDKWSRDRGASLLEANKSLQKTEWYKRVKLNKAHVTVGAVDGEAAGREAHIVVAQNGAVTFVESALILKSGESRWRPLAPALSLSDGDRVRTNIDGSVALRPYPLWDIYLDSNTEIVYHENSSEIELEVINGVAVVIQARDSRVHKQDPIVVSANNVKYQISSAGFYHFLVSSDFARMRIVQGTCNVDGRTVMGPNQITQTNTGSVIERLEALEDAFDIWSKRQNRKWVSQFRRHVYIGGVWIRAGDQFTFVPATRDYRSPYGGNYDIRYMGQDITKVPPTRDETPPPFYRP